MVPVTCINDKHRPFQISEGEWTEQDEVYYITGVAACSMNGVTGVSLYEKPLTHYRHFPYLFFAMRRFSIHAEHLEAFIQLMQDCNDLDELNVNTLVEKAIEEHQLEVVE